MVSDIVAFTSCIITLLSLIALIIFQISSSRRERDKIRYGIVYEEQFRICRDIYSQLSLLRDEVEKCTDQQLASNKRMSLMPDLFDLGDAFRSMLRQNDVILPESLSSEINIAWDSFKSNIYDYVDAVDQTGTKRPSQARRDVLDAIDSARARLRPHIRLVYGI